MAEFFAALPAFIQAIPYLLQIAVKMMNVTQQFVSWAQKNELDKWFDNVEVKIDQLDKAKTPDEKRTAAKDLSDIMRSLG